MKRDAPLIIRDVEQERHVDDNTRTLLGRLGMRSILAFPIVANGEWIGTLTAQNSEARLLADDDLRQISALVDQASIKIQAVRLLDETRKRAAELETVAKVSAAATTLLNPDDLLQAVVDLTKSAFDLYHVHIYLLDEAGERLVLTSGAGEPGRIMKQQGRAIMLTHPNSLVARAGRTREGAISNDVTKDPDFLPNPLLPNTKSELAVPLIVSDRLIGVLDVQADVTNRFSVEDVTIQSTLADQIAVAIENARAFSRIQETEVERLIGYEVASHLNEAANRQQVLEATLSYPQQSDIATANLFYIDVDIDNNPIWAEVAAEWAKSGVTATATGSRYYLPEFPISRLWMSSPNEPLLIGDLNTSSVVDETTRRMMQATGVQALAILPMLTQGRWIGFLSFSWSKEMDFSDQDRRIYTSMMQQATATVDALRSAEETQQAREDAETLYRVSTLINEAQSEQDIVNAIVQYAIPDPMTSVSLNLNEGGNYENASYTEVVASWRRDGTSNTGMRIPLAGFSDGSSDPRAMTVINEVKNELPEAVHSAYEAFGVAAIVTIPLMIGGRVIGSLSLAGPNAYYFSNREIQMWRAIAEQTATTMERFFLSRQTNRRAAELQTVAQVSA
ncbi:MAG: GAF domain-containing protein, partial [Anaerolineae bacterium]|nr:GAF domain-containing protein [Anaerolineae bacterium]